MTWFSSMRGLVFTLLAGSFAVAAAQTTSAPSAKTPAPNQPAEESTPPEDLEPKDFKPAARQLLDRAKAAHARRRFDEAAALAEKALAIDSRAPTAYYILYTVRALVKRDHNAAIQTLQAGVQACPDAPSVHYNLGNVYSSRMQHREALAAFRRALSVAKTPRPLFQASAHYNIGNELSHLGDRSAAIQSWREAVAHNPKHFQAQRNIVIAYYDMTAWGAARTEAKKLQEADPTGPAGAWATEALRRIEATMSIAPLLPKSR